jgi:predicted component of type VI protein secretion system
MSRCRLRFHFHELDLPIGTTTIGRGAECHITLDDPLASRKHVRIVVGGDRVVVEDLGSRNGVFVNGTPIRRLTQLRDGDRVRVGAQEFVFSQPGHALAAPLRRVTGELRFCASCRLPYPREVMSCPACEETEQVDEDTLTGGGVPDKASLPLLVDALERAMAIGRVGDAQRLVRRTSEQIDQLVAMGGSVDAELLAALAVQAAELTAASHDPAWALWALDVYRDTRQIPPVDVVERLARVGTMAAQG